MRTSTPLTAADVRTLIALVPEAATGFATLEVNLQGLEVLGEAIAIRWHNQLLGCGGLVPLWPGVVAAWVVFTPHARRHVLATFRAVRGFVVDYAVKHHTYRIECSIHTDIPKAGDLAEMLGMVCEGVRRQYLPGRLDAWLYAWVREGT